MEEFWCNLENSAINEFISFFKLKKQYIKQQFNYNYLIAQQISKQEFITPGK